MELLLVLAGGVNRLVEVIKLSLFANIELNKEVQHALTILLSLVLGIVAVFGAGVTLVQVIPDNPLLANVPVVAGQIALGLLVGAGSGAIHAVLNFFETMKGRVAIQDAVVSVTTTSAPANFTPTLSKTWTATAGTIKPSDDEDGERIG